MASSFTRPMLIMRKVFSSSFAISAASAVETDTTVSSAPRYQAAATSPQAGVIPPTTFGVFRVVQSSRPGSTRSGEKQMKTSSPTFSPDFSVSIGSRLVVNSTLPTIAPPSSATSTSCCGGDSPAVSSATSICAFCRRPE